MKIYPILFGPHGGLVAGKGFIASVSIRGRCLFEETDKDFFSVLGVNPGAVAGDGTTMSEAHRDFVERIRLIVFEIAEESGSFEEFKAEVVRFVEETNRPNRDLWDRAVEKVRAGEVDLEGVHRENAESKCWARVELVATEAQVAEQGPINPDMNEPPTNDEVKIAAGF